MKRQPSTDKSTAGRLFVNGVFECHTLEDVVRDGPKVIHETAIPAGRYTVVITQSQRFGRMLPLLLDVPGFSGVRIHPGNSQADTSGCILVGRFPAEDRLAGSRLAMDALQPKIAGALARGEDVTIDIRSADGSEGG